MDTNKMRDISREQFEAWHRSVVEGEPPHEKYDNGDYRNPHVQRYWLGWQASREAVVPSGWQDMETCPQHTDVLFYRGDAGVFTGMITDADHFLSDKERDEWEGTEEEMFDLDAFGFGDWGVCRCDGSERPTHWMPLPAEPKV